jgi:hypothetical protein
MIDRWGPFKELDFYFRFLCWGMPQCSEKRLVWPNLLGWGLPEVLEIFFGSSM